MKQIIVNCMDRETRVAIIENQKLMELWLERPTDVRIVGSIYKGRVTDILPGMQAAFVDIGLEKNAYLYVDDCLYDKNGERKPNIREILKEGQEIVVQVKKEPLGTKGARVSAQLSFPGRFLVYMPFDSYIGISRKIEQKQQRDQLEQWIQSICQKSEGAIVRTAAEDATEAEIKADFHFLQGLWKKAEDHIRHQKTPSLIYRDLDLVSRLARDLLTEDVHAFILDDQPAYQKIITQLEPVIPHLMDRVKLYRDRKNIFDAYEVEGEIEKALRRKVWLKSGGYLIIDQTEAFTSIDVNTGKFTGSHDLEETVFKTNQEAVSEIVRQLRLRDIGGIILIDFIDMRKPAHRDVILQALKDLAKTDRTRTHILGFTQLGLLEMTRKKARENLTEFLMRPCPYCDGKAKIASEETVASRLEREIKEHAKGGDIEAILVEAHPQVLQAIKGKEEEHVTRMKSTWGITVCMKPNESMHQQDYHLLYLGSLHEVQRRLQKN